MKAMVLAAGLGERMKPLTWDRAKPALPLLNRPSVLHLLEHLARNGVDQVAINLHYCPDTVRALEPDIRALGLRVFFSHEPTILGTGGGLKKAEEFLRDGTLIMANADFVTDCPLALALEHHHRSGALATLVLTPFQEGTEYGAVEMGDDHRIVRIAGHPGGETGKPRYHFTGIHILDPAIFQQIPPAVKSEINREIYPKLIERGEHILGYVHAGFWRELGTPQRYLQGSLDLVRLGDAGYMQRIRLREGVYSASPLSSLQGSIEPAFFAGADLEMSSDSLAAEAVLGNRVVLGHRSRVARSILWDDVRIAEDSSLTECLVGAGARIPARTRLARKVVLDEATYGGDRGRLERSGSLLLASF